MKNMNARKVRQGKKIKDQLFDDCQNDKSSLVVRATGSKMFNQQNQGNEQQKDYANHHNSSKEGSLDEYQLPRENQSNSSNQKLAKSHSCRSMKN